MFYLMRMGFCYAILDIAWGGVYKVLYFVKIETKPPLDMGGVGRSNRSPDSALGLGAAMSRHIIRVNQTTQLQLEGAP
jgi:hypothetical protein